MMALLLIIMLFQHTAARRRLVTQLIDLRTFKLSFNTQPPEGGWEHGKIDREWFTRVSTHSRPKAAGANQTMNQPA